MLSSRVSSLPLRYRHRMGSRPICSNDSVTVARGPHHHGHPRLHRPTTSRSITRWRPTEANGTCHGAVRWVVHLQAQMPTPTATIRSHSPGTDSDGPSTPATIIVHVTAVNDAPSFTKGPDKTVSESSSAQSFPNWATGISKGPADESGDVLNFVIDNASPDLFSVGPAVSPTGTSDVHPDPRRERRLRRSHSIYTMTAAPPAAATTQAPTRRSRSASIRSTIVPSFTKGADQTDLEDAGRAVGPELGDRRSAREPATPARRSPSWSTRTPTRACSAPSPRSARAGL